MKLSVCVLICTCNRHDLLRGALKSLAACDPSPDSLVVVNGGDERADDVLSEWAEPHIPLKAVKTRNVNLAVSRNIGLEFCDADIIAMTDDDAEVFPDWIAAIKDAFQRYPEAGAVGGPVIGTTSHTLVGKVADITTFPACSGIREVRTIPGVNIAYRQRAVKAVGSYDPDLFRGEDVDFNWRLIRSGYKIIFDPAIRVYHHHRPTARALINQHYMYGRAYYRVRRKWPDMHTVVPGGSDALVSFRKAVLFVGMPMLIPVMQAVKMGLWGIPALPLLYAREYAWRYGILKQALIDRRTSHNDTDRDAK